MATLTAFLASPEGMAVYAVIVIMLADWVSGVAAAFRDGTFRLDSVAAFIRKHALGRVFPIAAFLAIGYFGAQPALSALGAAMAAGYLAETIGSIRASWGSGSRGNQPVPKD